MQPSMFNLRVPLPARDEVFLMNTLTDAQLVVSSDVAALLDRVARRESSATLDARERARRSTCCVENGFLVESRERRSRGARQLPRRASRATPTELNITVLTTLQCNFACDYCFQGDHGDYNKFADKMSLETAGARRRLDRARARSRPPREVRADVLRRRAAAEPAGDVLPRRAAVARDRRRAASQLVISIITNGLLLTEEVVDRLLPFGLNGREDHARRRSRHAQPDAAAARRPGHLRPHRREHPPRRRPVPDRHRRQLRRELGRELSRRCSSS